MPAARASALSARPVRRARVTVVMGSAVLGRVEVELGGRRVALVGVAGGLVERDVDLVAVLVAAEERAERDAAQVGQRSGVLRGRARAARGAGAAPGAAVGDDDVELARERVGRVGV